MGWVDSQLVVMQEGTFREHSREPGASPCCMSTQQAGRADSVLLLCCRFCPDFRNVTCSGKEGQALVIMVFSKVVISGELHRRPQGLAGKSGWVSLPRLGLAFSPEVAQDSRRH